MEHIMCVDNRVLKPYLDQSCFVPWSAMLLSRIERNGYFYDRSKAEEDERCKQIIPYVILQHPKTGKVFCYRRQGSEERLNGQWSIGLGGHWRCGESLQQCIERELTEELNLGMYNDVYPAGFVTANETPVDRVHFGIVFVLESDAPITPADGIDEWKWAAPKKIDVELERWSGICHEAVFSSK